MRKAALTLKTSLLAFACAFLVAPQFASAALSLDIRPQNPNDNPCAPGRHALDLIFTETAPTENEGLFAYDLLLTVPAAARGMAALDGIAAGGGPGFVLGEDPTKYTFSVAESDANHVLANISSNNDLFDITTGKRAATLFYTMPAAMPPAFAIAIDPAATVFGSGDPNRLDVNIAVDLTDAFTVTCPEPAGLALLGLAGTLVLRRRRYPRGS